jgi:murein DD-endopeptidase MepM/ murein hydrolase activator NlpD
MLILPLTLTVFTFLLLGRRRALGIGLVPIRLLHSPETNVRFYRRRLKEPLRLPFFGTWFVSQGVDGGVTHRGRLKHAWDFMVRDERGRTFVTPGYRLADYHAFGLLVSAPAPGRVVIVENRVKDNPPGKLNRVQNWGNWVIIEHSPLEYSIVAHLQQGSIRVKPGDRVVAGTVIGACGNSGFSGEPHLHYQLQTAPLTGSDTVPVRFRNYLVVTPDGERFVRDGVPDSGETVQPLVVQEEIRNLLLTSLGREMTFIVRRAPVAGGRGRDAESCPESRVNIAASTQRERGTLRSGNTLVTLGLESEGVAVQRITGPRSALLRQTFEGLVFIPFYSHPGLTLRSDSGQHSFGRRDRLDGQDALILESRGKIGDSPCFPRRKAGQSPFSPGTVERRIWFVAGLGIARIDWRGPEPFTALRVPE